MQLTRQQRWRQEHPDRYRAHLDVQRALRTGALTPRPCEICGKPKAEAHHSDYRKPLDVRWLCRKHHSQMHRQEG